MGSAHGQVLIELHLVGLLALEVVACAAKAQSVRLSGGSLDIADLDWQVEGVVLGL